MLNLPGTIVDFLYWWLVSAPKRIYITFQRATALINNELSFTLNIRLMFTPLFGDYTVVGRMIGFTFRIWEIIVGSLILIVMWIFTLISPLIWWSLPLFIIYNMKWAITPIIITAYLLRTTAVANTPRKRTGEIKEDNLSDNELKACYRLKAISQLHKVQSKKSESVLRLLHLPEIQFVLKKAELLNEEFIKELSKKAENIEATALSKTAYDYAKNTDTRYVETEHIFLALLALIPDSETFLAVFSSDLPTVEGTVKWIVSEREELSRIFFWQEDYQLPTMGGIGKGMTGRVTPLLDSVSEDFTRKAQKGWIRKIIGREKEIKEIAQILSGSKVNILIVGEPGSGKTSIVKGIAFRILKGFEYDAIKFKRIVSLETSSLIAGTKSAGELSEKLNRIMDEVEKSGDIILFIDEIHTLISAVQGEGADVSNIFSILEPHLTDHNIQFIGATTIENYRKYIEPNGAFARLFEIVEVPPSSRDDTIEILKYVSGFFQNEYKILITFPAIKRVIGLSDKLIHERVLPDKAIDILNRTASTVAYSTRYLTAEDVAKEISEITHVPVTAISEDESSKLLNIENEMKKRVIGQDNAIMQIGAALKRARVGIRNESKPIASFLFVGTTGVGKTETAKTLAKTYFGDEEAMIRLDMSEYQQRDSIDRLIGTPDGRSKGVLSEAVRTKPFALILLDEIEKADSNILLTFLQVLDDGRLTDTTGRVVDFTNTIIIATSNVGTRSIQEIVQRDGSFEQMRDAVMKNVRQHYAPEFLNRFNGIIVFKPLNILAVKKIADLLLNRVRKMADEKGVKVSFKEELIDELVKRGYSPEWGARPLARLIETSVETNLAEKLLAKTLNKGDTVELGMEVFDNAESFND
ncbi:hypothetical protein A2976_03240 [candidate division WWE3 bacterium RIFCSPLOWO2_01_FULL_41_9]|uniref:Clp R domain-containing protein n=1 Tax=candidate division WWE3 bacterium RIFCSPLOWO2_01_FULL_41_9 TaxID=1802626 RepID=A0A1F4VME2_UNCKA|nr:MAG: hypothetical protein A2976_03240 [candidate division WWE3 bacterium RIFCSPLOWO2_01_FULL_41_9]